MIDHELTTEQSGALEHAVTAVMGVKTVAIGDRCVHFTYDLVQIADTSLSKTELIRKLQLSEGNLDCYAKASDGICDQVECLWRYDCLQVPRRTK